MGIDRPVLTALDYSFGSSVSKEVPPWHISVFDSSLASALRCNSDRVRGVLVLKNKANNRRQKCSLA